MEQRPKRLKDLLRGPDPLRTDIGRRVWRRALGSGPLFKYVSRAAAGADERTRELGIADLMEVEQRPRPTAQLKDRLQSRGVSGQLAGGFGMDGDFMMDGLAGAVRVPSEERTQQLGISDLEIVDGETGQMPSAETRDAKPVQASGGAGEDRDGPAPSVLTSLDEVRRVLGEKTEKEREAEADRRIEDAMDSELRRFARPAAEAPAEADKPAEAGIFRHENPEDFIESADWEPQTTEPVAVDMEDRITLFDGPQEGKVANVSELCSATYLDYNPEDGSAFIRLDHKASGAYETFILGLSGQDCHVFATDDGLVVGIKADQGRIRAKIRETYRVFPDFTARKGGFIETGAVILALDADWSEPLRLGHGFCLMARRALEEQGLQGPVAILELYLSENDEDASYSKEFMYQRRLELGHGRDRASFMIGLDRIDVRLEDGKVRVSRSVRKKAGLPKPDSRSGESSRQAGTAFDEAFRKSLGGAYSEREEPAPHGFEDAMGMPEQTQARAEENADDMTVMVFQESCKAMQTSGLAGQGTGFLVAGLSNPDRSIRRLAAGTFAAAAGKNEELGQEAIDALTSALRDTDETVKRNANNALFYANRSGAAVDRLIAMTLRDPRKEKQTSVVLSLNDLKELIEKND